MSDTSGYFSNDSVSGFDSLDDEPNIRRRSSSLGTTQDNFSLRSPGDAQATCALDNLTPADARPTCQLERTLLEHLNDLAQEPGGFSSVPLVPEPQPPTSVPPTIAQNMRSLEDAQLVSNTGVVTETSSALGAGAKVCIHWQEYFGVSASQECRRSSVPVDLTTHTSSPYPGLDLLRQLVYAVLPALELPKDPEVFLNLVLNQLCHAPSQSGLPGSSADVQAPSTTAKGPIPDVKRLVLTWRNMCQELGSGVPPVNPCDHRAWFKHILTRPLPKAHPTRLDDTAMPPISAVEPIMLPMRPISMCYTHDNPCPLPQQRRKETSAGVKLPTDTWMGPFVWDGQDHGPMPADRFWSYLKEASLVPRRLSDTSSGCKWPGCKMTNGVTGQMKGASLKKHINCVHLQFRQFCTNKGCDYSCRSDMFATRHSTCNYGPTIDSEEGILVY